MKIAVVGPGAVGSYYGAMLARAGHDVHFLLRSDYDTVRQRGVRIRSPKGNFHVQPRPARKPGEIGISDFVLIGLKTTANDQFPVLLPQLVDRHTAILTLQNGLGNEEQLAQLFPADQILGGLCFVCLNRLEPGLIHHIDHGLVVIGEYQRWPEPRTHDLAGAFRHAGVPSHVTDNLARAHWEKLVWNIPFNGLGVAGTVGFDAVIEGEIEQPHHTGSAGAPAGAVIKGQIEQHQTNPTRTCLTTDQLLADPQWAGLVKELMLEVITIANGLDHKLAPSLADMNLERTRTMGAYKASTLLDFERRQPLELTSLFLEPLRQARAAGVAAPRLEALCRVLRQLNQVEPQ